MIKGREVRGEKKLRKIANPSHSNEVENKKESGEKGNKKKRKERRKKEPQMSKSKKSKFNQGVCTIFFLFLCIMSVPTGSKNQEFIGA